MKQVRNILFVLIALSLQTQMVSANNLLVIKFNRATIKGSDASALTKFENKVLVNMGKHMKAFNQVKSTEWSSWDRKRRQLDGQKNMAIDVHKAYKTVVLVCNIKGELSVQLIDWTIGDADNPIEFSFAKLHHKKVKDLSLRTSVPEQLIQELCLDLAFAIQEGGPRPIINVSDFLPKTPSSSSIDLTKIRNALISEYQKHPEVSRELKLAALNNDSDQWMQMVSDCQFSQNTLSKVVVSFDCQAIEKKEIKLGTKPQTPEDIGKFLYGSIKWKDVKEAKEKHCND